MVHPYLRRRNGQEVVQFPSDALGAVLGKTLGVPLFQEQAMQIAIVGAGFSPEEADRLRRALATFKKHGNVTALKDRFLEGMKANGYDDDFAARALPRSRASAAMAFPKAMRRVSTLLVYASAWLKRQPSGNLRLRAAECPADGLLCARADRTGCARAWGHRAAALHHPASHWDNVMEDLPGGVLALRLGFRQVRGMPEDEAMWIAAARATAIRRFRMSGAGPGWGLPR